MVEFEYTPRVAQETAGLGFSLPLPQRQVGVDVRNANPNTRAAMAQAMPFYEMAEDITPALTNLRDAYIADVQGLNTFVQEAVALGYDPRTIDYQDPQSVEINKIYRQKLEPIKLKELELRSAKPIVDATTKGRGLFNPQAMGYGQIDPFYGAEDVVRGFNQSLSSQGYGQEGFSAAQQAREEAIANINNVYSAQAAKYQDNPTMLASLEDMRKREIAGLESVTRKEPPRPPRDPIADFEAREIVKANIELQKEQIKTQGKYEKALKQMTPRAVSGNLIVKGKDGKKVRDVGTRMSAPLTKTMEPANVTAKYYSKSTPIEERGNLRNFRYDAMEIVGIDKDGNVIDDDKVPVSGRFEVLMKGSATSDYVGKRGKMISKNIPVYDTFGNVVRGLSEEEELAYEQVYDALNQQAAQMNASLRGGSTPAATGQNTQATDVSSIFGRQ